MKAESNLKPNKIEIENISNERCDIVLAANIVEIQEEENVKYTYDSYRINVCYNEKMKEELETNYEEYLKLAIAEENRQSAIKEIEQLQDELNNTDYKITKSSECQLAGVEIPYDMAELHSTRQKLRDRINELQKML